MVAISISLDVLANWAYKNARYVALLKSDTFRSEVQSAYEDLERKADGRVKMRSLKKFMESAEMKVAIEFAAAAADAYFSGTSTEQVEDKTISNPQWVSKQIRFARDLAWNSMQVSIWGENRAASPVANEFEEGEENWND